MRVLDATAGSRAVWFDKRYPDTVFIDVRDGMFPGNTVMDARHTSFKDGEFDLVICDPPHMCVGPASQMAKRYGHWTTAEIRAMVRDFFVEFHRILRPDGLVAFKWNDHDTPLKTVLGSAQIAGFEPLVGVPTAHRTKHSSVTYWCLLRRVDLEGRSPLQIPENWADELNGGEAAAIDAPSFSDRNPLA